MSHVSGIVLNIARLLNKLCSEKKKQVKEVTTLCSKQPVFLKLFQGTQGTNSRYSGVS